MKALATDWIKHVPENKRESFETALRNSTVALGRLYDIVSEWEDELNRADSTMSDFDNPNWALRAAARQGDRQRIRKLKDLLSFIKDRS